MHWVDLLIISFVVLGLVRGMRIGLFRQSLAFAGFFGGLFLGSVLAAHTAYVGQTLAERSMIAVAVTLMLALLLSVAGEYAGIRLAFWARRHNYESVDGALGAVFQVVAILFASWLVAGIIALLPAYHLRAALGQSRILATLDRVLPPAPKVITELAQLINPNGFPRVFIDGEPSFGSVPKTPADFTAAVSRDRSSVVKIEGLGCGGIVEGSGFVVAPGYVATNAHVVAGVSREVVIDSSGDHAAYAVYFDPNTDFAVMKVDGLADPPLDTSTAIARRGQPVAVLGYPEGGPFAVATGPVIDAVSAAGRDIYDQGIVYRSIYELEATVVPGNSGGPVITPDGRVIGVVFASSANNQQIGYALLADQLQGATAQARQSSAPVSTGDCASGIE